MESPQTLPYPFLHYVEDDMYRVAYIQTDHGTGLVARDWWRVPLEHLGARSWKRLFRLVDSHLKWSNRTATPFVSVWSDRAHAVNFAKSIAKKPRTKANSVSVSRFLSFYSQTYPLINVEEYVRYWRLPKKDYYRHEWLVFNHVLDESICETIFVDRDADGKVRVVYG